MLVPSPAFRSMALGIMLAVVFILAASLTLLPAMLAKLGPRVDKRRAPLGALRRAPLAAFARWAERLWRHPIAVRRRRARDPARPRAPGLRAEDRHAVDQGRADRRHLPLGLHAGAAALRPRRPRRAPDRRAEQQRPPPSRRSCGATPASPASCPRRPPSGGLALIEAVPKQDPSSKAVGSTIDRLRAALPAGTLVGGAAAENHDLEQALSAQDAARDRRRARPRLPAAADRAAGAR